jgi:hypothetical protein
MYGNLSKRVDSLVAINEMTLGVQFEENQETLKNKADELVNALTYVTKDIFDKPINEIPIRFSKYFLTVVYKLCSIKIVM